MEVTKSGSLALLRCAKRRALLAVATPLVAALLLTPGITRAQTGGAATAESGALQEVIVTAERGEERALEVPVSTAGLRGESLAGLGTGGPDGGQVALWARRRHSGARM